MSAFVLIGAVMTLAAILCIVLPLRGGKRPEVDVGAGQSNLSILRDQVGELEADLAIGAITAEHYSIARAELERRVLEEATGDSSRVESHSAGRSVAALGVLIPAAAVALYVWIGAPEGLRHEAVQAEQQISARDIEKMVTGLAARLEKNPDDARGWVMLARSYYVLQRMPEAAAAYAKAAERTTADADLLADYADALALSQGKRIDGKPLELVLQALKINPSHPKALAMAGTAAFYRNDYSGAIAYWEKLLPLLPSESEMAKSVVGGIAEARQLGTTKTGEGSAGAVKPAEKVQSQSAQKPSASATVSGKVTLSPELANKAKPEDALFIVARAANGPRMPLAVVRRRVADLPIQFTLDDALAMSPELKLSAFAEVLVTARISKSGNALSQPGDLQGMTAPVKVGAKDLVIVIDSVVP